jgi:hypothetical protein
MSRAPSTSIVYPYLSLHNPPSRRHSDRPIMISCLPPSQLRQVSTDRACRVPALRISTAAKGFPLPRTSKVYPWPPIPPCKPRHVPRVWLSVTYTPVPSCAVHVAATEGRVQQKGRRFEAKPARRCPSGLLMMRGRGWNHSTMMRNVLDITRASLSLVHDACASVVLSSSSVESSPLSHNVGVT